jgi:RNA recognition motif-containing protein
MLVKLFVGNLAWSVDDQTLEDVFNDFGTVQSARVVNDRDTGRSRGFGFVEIDVDDLSEVIRKTDGLDINGRAIRVNEAEDKGGPRRSGPSTPRSGGDRGDRGGFNRRY